MASPSASHEHAHGSAPRPDPPAAGSHTHHAPRASGHEGPGAHDRHAGHSVEMFRDRFWITLLLSLPTLVWSDMIQAWFGFTAPAFAGAAYIPPLFGTAVYV